MRCSRPGEDLKLVETGNHAQGCIFRDGAHLWTLELEEAIDRHLAIPGFYIGRYDIRYANEEELRRGENFQIVELNGAASEATNIYDARNSLGRRIARFSRNGDSSSPSARPTARAVAIRLATDALAGMAEIFARRVILSAARLDVHRFLSSNGERLSSRDESRRKADARRRAPAGDCPDRGDVARFIRANPMAARGWQSMTPAFVWP